MCGVLERLDYKLLGLRVRGNGEGDTLCGSALDKVKYIRDGGSTFDGSSKNIGFYFAYLLLTTGFSIFFITFV